MSKEIECPYCEHEQDICHDDGFGYEENISHQMECENCNKSFVFQTSISFYYEPYKADCLNDGKHDYKITSTIPNCFAKMRCTMCDCERELTDQEKIDHKITTIEDYMKTLKDL